MQKLIIYLTGKPLLDGFNKREFKWSEEHQVFVFEGRELELGEFNLVWERAFRTNADLVPRARVVGDAEAAKDDASEIIADLKESLEQSQRLCAELNRDLAAAERAADSKEPTLDEAIAVVAKQAPERLKKLGGKPQAVAIEV